MVTIASLLSGIALASVTAWRSVQTPPPWQSPPVVSSVLFTVSVSACPREASPSRPAVNSARPSCPAAPRPEAVPLFSLTFFPQKTQPKARRTAYHDLDGYSPIKAMMK